MKHFQKFTDTTEALSATTAAIEGKLSKTLRKTLKSLFAEEAHEALAVADAKLGSAIKGKIVIFLMIATKIKIHLLYRKIADHMSVQLKHPRAYEMYSKPSRQSNGRTP